MLQAAASAAGPPLVASPYPQAYLQYSQVIQGMPHYPGQVTIVLVVLALILIHAYNSIGPETQNVLWMEVLFQ
jgi:hypothetical protein